MRIDKLGYPFDKNGAAYFVDIITLTLRLRLFPTSPERLVGTVSMIFQHAFLSEHQSILGRIIADPKRNSNGRSMGAESKPSLSKRAHTFSIRTLHRQMCRSWLPQVNVLLIIGLCNTVQLTSHNNLTQRKI